MARQIKKGATNQSIELYIVDDTDGTPETGVLFNTGGIDIKYRREGATVVSITEVDLASPALNDAHLDGGFLAIGNGAYRFDLPDAAIASGADSVVVFGTVTGMIILPVTIQLVAYDPQDTIRLGLTAIPNAVADAAGGLPISDAGGLDLDTKLANTDEITAVRMAILTDWINGGRLDVLLDAIPTTAMRGTDNANTTTPPTVAQIQAEMEEDGLSLLDTIRDELANGTDGLSALKALLDAIPTTAMRGTDNAATATALSTHDGKLDTLDTVADGIQTDLSNATDGLGALKTLIDALNDLSTSQVNAEVDTALSDINLDKLIPANGSVETSGSNSSTQVQTNLSEATNNHYNGMGILFTSGAEAGQARLIDNYVGATGIISWVRALTGIPADAVTFIILSSYQVDLLTASQSTLDGIQTDLDNGTDGLGALKALLDAIQGTTFSSATDSLEAIRNRGDAAWTTGGGGSITDILNVAPLIPNDIDLANTATVRLGLMLTNALDDLPTAAEITPGTISIDRKAIGGTSWTSIIADAACSEIDGLIYYDEVFDSGTGYGEGDSVRITFKSQKITVSANDYDIIGASGRMFYTNVRQTMRGTDSANTTVPDVAGTAPTAIEIRQEMDSNSVDLNTLITSVAAIITDLDNGTDGLGALRTLIAALNNISAAEVNTEVDAALATTTYGEPGQGIPGVTISLKDKIGYIYKFLRNKVNTTSTAINVRDDGDSVNDQKATISDDGTTFTRGEFGTGA